MSLSASESNPFATRFVRPGAMEYLFPPGLSAEALVERLRASHWQGEIVGPHGAGKSTMLATLLPQLAIAGRTVVHVALHAGEKSLPPGLDAWRAWSSNTQIVVDGYEQLSWWSRSKLAWRVRERGAGLLVTSHAPTGLPLLIEVGPQLDVTRQVVRKLVPDDSLITDDDIATAFEACDGNVRETLFRLYDVYSLRERTNDEGIT
jgi:hypothetical protein